MINPKVWQMFSMYNSAWSVDKFIKEINKRLKTGRGGKKKSKPNKPQTFICSSCPWSYNVIFPYLVIPLHFALSAIMQAPTKKVTPKYSKQGWSNILIKIHVMF